MAAVFNQAGYVFQDASEIPQHIIIPVTQDDDAVFVEPIRAPCICSLAEGSIVLTSVDLDREFDRWAVEIEDIAADRMLMPELQIVDLAASQCFPKLGFRIRQITAQSSRALGYRLRASEARR